MKEHKQIGKFTIALGRAMRGIHTNSIELMRENGLTMAQFTVLEALYQKGPLTVQEIIDKVLSTSGNMTVVIRNLEKVGLVTRMVNEADRRSYLISLTDEGLSLIETIFPKHMEYLNQALAVLTEYEIETVTNILFKLSHKQKEGK